MSSERFTNTMPTREQIATAYHEAGHAVATWLFGYGCVIEKVSIVAEQDFLGILEASGPLSNMHPDADSSPEVIKALEDEVVILYSGPMAQEHFGPDFPWKYGAGKDIVDAADAINFLMKLGEDVDPVHERFQEQAKRLVRKHWNEIEVLAAALCEHKQLTGAEAVKVLETATGREVPRSPLFDYQNDLTPEWAR